MAMAQPWHLSIVALDALTITGHFLARNVWDPRGQPRPETRDAFVAAVARALA